jgi:hypothetical protein
LQTSVGNIEYGYRLSADELHVEAVPGEQAALAAIRLESVVRAINQGAAKGPQRVA